jgi:CBS domain-containing protein
MLERRVDALPVVGTDGHVIGVLTGSDLVRTLLTAPEHGDTVSRASGDAAR